MSDTTTMTAARHWLYGHCVHPALELGKHPWMDRPWLLELGGRTWTLATGRLALLLLLGRHADAIPADAAVLKACAAYLGPVPPGETFVWGEFRAWLGPVQPREPCSDCGGDGKWRIIDPHLEPEEVAELKLTSSDLSCDGCEGTGVSSTLPMRPVLVCGVVVNANLLAHALDAPGRAFGELLDPADLVEASPARHRKSGRGIDPDGPLTVRRAGAPLWQVVVMPLTGDTAADALADAATPRWPPPA